MIWVRLAEDNVGYSIYQNRAVIPRRIVKMSLPQNGRFIQIQTITEKIKHLNDTDLLSPTITMKCFTFKLLIDYLNR